MRRAFLTFITKKNQNQPNEIGVHKGTELPGEFRKIAELKEYKLTLQ